eukprot:TRINITY_DN1546_c0_g2_i1.p1 TRINITY_DN1546_c0_g2~~TRINITY_DN1546_c0_g2_i1.p1  ORF type:complete len:246 (-),score=66.62 TRINITY_DN1546_c0_g2_i1:282-995(-)
MSFAVGFWLKSVAIALEAKALALVGIHPDRIPLNAHRTIVPLWDRIPLIEPETLLTPNSTITSDVHVAERSSVGFATNLRGDRAPIYISSRTWIGDRVIATTFEHPPFSQLEYPPIIVGTDTTIGPGSSLNGCQIGDSCIVGSGCIILPGSVMEPFSCLGTGSVLGPDQTVPSGEYWAGNPAQKIRDLTPEEKEAIPLRSSKLRESSEDQCNSFEWENPYHDEPKEDFLNQFHEKKV